MDSSSRIGFETPNSVDGFTSPLDHAPLGEAPASRAERVRQISIGSAIEHGVKDLIRRRRQRAEFFPAGLFADPAWDILLALALADCQQRRMTVTNLCNSVDAPMTTALRWIQLMTDDGHLIRRNDVHDRRRKFIELSPLALDKMIQYCSRDITPRALAA